MISCNYNDKHFIIIIVVIVVVTTVIIIIIIINNNGHDWERTKDILKKTGNANIT